MKNQTQAIFTIYSKVTCAPLHQFQFIKSGKKFVLARHDYYTSHNGFIDMRLNRYCVAGLFDLAAGDIRAGRLSAFNRANLISNVGFKIGDKVYYSFEAIQQDFNLQIQMLHDMEDFITEFGFAAFKAHHVDVWIS